MRLRPDTLGMTVAFAMLTALGPLCTDMYIPSLPEIARDLDATLGETQFTLSIFMIAFAVGQFAYGPVSDRIGRRPVLLFGLALFLAASLACTLAQSIEALSAARFVQALGASGPIVLGRAMVRDLYEGARAGRELSRIGSIMGLVPAVAPVIGGVLDQVAGWRSSFFAMLLFGVAVTAMVGLLLPETLRERAKTPLSFGSVLKGFWALMRVPSYMTYVGLQSLAYGGLFAFISGCAFVLQGHFGLGAVGTGLSFAFTVAGFIAGTLLAQRLVGRRGLNGVIALGVAAEAAGGVLMLSLMGAGVPSSLALTLPMALYTLGVGLVMPQSLAAALQPFPDRAGAASSLMGIAQMSTAALVGIGVGQALQATASPLPLPAVIAATGLLSLVLFRGSIRARATEA